MAIRNTTIWENSEHSSEALRHSIVGCISEMGTIVIRDRPLDEWRKSDQIASDLHQQVMFFVFRLVFLHLGEKKGLWVSNDQSIASLHQNHTGWSVLLERFHTLWYGDEENDILAIGTDLWEPSSCSLITQTKVSKTQFKKVLLHLNSANSSVDWTSVTAKGLSHVFESVLELVPIICLKSRTYTLTVKEGNTRKSSGSYYTPVELVDRVLLSTLVPAMENVLEDLKREAQDEALLSLTLCDPSCGSGNFLVEAARLMAKRLTAIRQNDTLDSGEVYQGALKDVLQQCIYGVDSIH